MKDFFRWMQPGIGIKRWVVMIGAGLIFVSLGIAMLLVNFYRTVGFSGVAGVFAYYSTGQFITRPWRAVLLILGGGIFATYGTWHFQSAFLEPFLTRREKLFDTLQRYYRANRGPRIVTIGGGTGMSLLLRGVKEYSNSITAIVTVADSGGSSGRLRKNLGVLPPGDIRQNIIALSDTESLMAKLFDYRFEGDRYGEGLSLEGQNFGNLFLVAMNNITGDFAKAVTESSRILAIRGRVLPSTVTPITLCARLKNGEIIREEENIDLGKFVASPIEKVFLEPEAPTALPEAVDALKKAEIIILGPGDLYTSILPNLLVPEISEAIKQSSAVKFFVCNVANKPTETANYSVSSYLETFVKHIGDPLVHFVLINNNFDNPPRRETTPYVKIDQEKFKEYRKITFVQDDFIEPTFTVRHDPKKVASAIMTLFKEVNF
ncbi:MAG: gluconeogenesis factor YvcK family protein [bacterium]